MSIKIILLTILFLCTIKMYCQNLPDYCYLSLLDNQDCSWYIQCLQRKYQCGKNGYPVGYGHKYCLKFGLLKQTGSPLVGKWVESATNCLKKSLQFALYQNKSDLKCHKLKRRAFSTHPLCYVGAGFCTVWFQLGFHGSIQFLKQLLQIYQVKDFMSVVAVNQIFVVLRKCIAGKKKMKYRL